ncbi:hypothetical protein [Natrinema salsiterrestre]|nr:hypothetical protein [Natrinema salsiterrestre]
MTDIVEDWQQGNRTDPEALEALKRAKEDLLQVESETEERG